MGGRYNKGTAAAPPQPPILPPPCHWTHTPKGYYEARGGAAGNVRLPSGRGRLGCERMAHTQARAQARERPRLSIALAG